MKRSIGLVVFLCKNNIICLIISLIIPLINLGLASTSSITVWEEGKEYHFLEESAVQVGTNDLDSTVSGLRMMTDVKIQVSGNKLVVSLDNVQEAHYSHSYPSGSWPYRLMEEKVKDPKSK